MKNTQSNAPELTTQEKEAKLQTRRTRRLVRTGYTVKDAAAAFNITPKQVRRNIRRGHLLAVKVGIRYYIARAYFNAFSKARSTA